MSHMLEWVCDIAVYLILISIVLQVIPKKFRKYINFFTGVLLIILVINPVTKLFDADKALVEYFEIEEMRQALSDMEDMIKFTENVNEEKLIESYNMQIAEKITELIKEYGFRITDVQVSWNLDNEMKEYGSIKSIYLVLDEKRTHGTITINPVKVTIGEQKADAYTKAEVEEMKKIIAGFYNLEEEHINIMIQG
ncbi:MAG: hypothetical protein E7261_09130 [Lachnospiraceae bacterium]|nr:hypothetical protein [Lachnospiraceae bacterium]